MSLRNLLLTYLGLILLLTAPLIPLFMILIGKGAERPEPAREPEPALADAPVRLARDSRIVLHVVAGTGGPAANG